MRIRGNAFQVHEKYLTLARDAYTSGDRVMAENYFQHAEHYYRIVNATTDPSSANRVNGYSANGQQGGYGPMDDDEFEDEYDAPHQHARPAPRPAPEQPAGPERSEPAPEAERTGDRQQGRGEGRSDDRGDRGDRHDRSGERRRRGRFNGRDDDRRPRGDGDPQLALDNPPPAVQTVVAEPAPAPAEEVRADAAPAPMEPGADRPRRRRRRQPAAPDAGETPARDVDGTDTVIV